VVARGNWTGWGTAERPAKAWATTGHTVFRYGAAVLATALALVLQLLVWPYIQPLPFLVFFGAVMFSGWKGGWGPGLLATVLSALAANYFFLPPLFAFALSFQDLFSLALFTLVSTFVTLLNVSLRRGHRQAREHEEWLSTTLRSIGDGVIATDAAGRIVFLNPVAETLTQWSHEEARGRPLQEVFRIIGEHAREERESPVAKVLREGRVVGLANSTLLIRKDGTELPIDDSGAPIWDEQGTIRGVVLVFRDVTAKKGAARELAAQSRITRTIAENATLGLFMMDARQHCSFMNGEAERLTGFTLAEVQALDRPLHDVIHHTRPDGSPFPIEECPIDRALPQRMREQGEAVFVHKAGTFYPVAFTASPILENGVPVGTIIEVRNIAEEKRREAERTQLLQETRAAVRVRDEFLSVASHELRTPLTPLQLRLEALKSAAEKEPSGDIPATRVIKDVEVAQRQVRRLTELVESLLDVSRLSTGRLQLHLTEVDLAAAAREMVSQLQQQAQNAGCEVRLEAAGPVQGMWDQLRLEQVLTNLLTNAFKYGAGRPIHIRVWAEAGKAKLQVRDEGIGIDPAHHRRIFGMFERAVSDRHYGGLGLGLYITRQIIESLGGTIHVDSTPGQGASFTVELIQTPPPSPPPTQEPPPGP
jgi:PAS domain S-box-containing protein